MKILNVCGLLPLAGLKRENDIQIKIQQEIQKIDKNIEFVYLKSLPYSNFFLAQLKANWKKYYEYIGKRHLSVGGFETFIYPWVRLPTSSFAIDKSLLPLNKAWSLKKVARLLGNDISKFDLVLSQANISDGVVANHLSKLYNVPHIHAFRGVLTEQIYNARFMAEIMDNAKACITPSPTIYKFLRERNDDVLLMPHGVDDDYFYCSKNKDYSKARLITVARLLKLKNIDLVIKSLKVANDKRMDFDYVIVGDGPERKNLEALVSSLGLGDKITFPGWLNKEAIIDKLFSSNVMVMPSFPETLGRVFLEASAAKCLVVGHKGSGVDGLFENDESAIFCSPLDIEERILDIVGDIKNDRYQLIAERAFDIVTKLRWRSVAERYVDLMCAACRQDKQP